MTIPPLVKLLAVVSAILFIGGALNGVRKASSADLVLEGNLAFARVDPLRSGEVMLSVTCPGRELPSYLEFVGSGRYAVQPSPSLADAVRRQITAPAATVGEPLQSDYLALSVFGISIADALKNRITTMRSTAFVTSDARRLTARYGRMALLVIVPLGAWFAGDWLLGPGTIECGSESAVNLLRTEENRHMLRRKVFEADREVLLRIGPSESVQTIIEGVGDVGTNAAVPSDEPEGSGQPHNATSVPSVRGEGAGKSDLLRNRIEHIRARHQGGAPFRLEEPMPLLGEVPDRAGLHWLIRQCVRHSIHFRTRSCAHVTG
jgi:hypothetical protein